MLTENEIKFFFDGDLKCLKRSVSKPDVENPFIRASDLEEVPEVSSERYFHLNTFESMI